MSIKQYTPQGGHDDSINIYISRQTIKIPEGFRRQFGYSTGRFHQDRAVPETVKLAVGIRWPGQGMTDNK